MEEKGVKFLISNKPLESHSLLKFICYLDCGIDLRFSKILEKLEKRKKTEFEK